MIHKSKIKKPVGLGDTVANITKITGIDKVVKFVSEELGIEDCGCSKRQENLNKRFPYRKFNI